MCIDLKMTHEDFVIRLGVIWREERKKTKLMAVFIVKISLQLCATFFLLISKKGVLFHVISIISFFLFNLLFFLVNV